MSVTEVLLDNDTELTADISLSAKEKVMSQMKLLVFFLTAAAVFFSAGCTRYDHDTPDTGANRKVFKLITGIAPDGKVKKIYAYADELGVDPLYCAGFTAEPQVVEQIVKKLNMSKQISSSDGADLGPDSIPWWNIEERKKSRLYKAENKKSRIIWYLWHDPENGKCQALKWCH